MERGVVVRGRLHGRQIDLEEPVDQLDGEVEVVVRPVEPAHAKPVESIFDFIRKLPPGTRTKEDIDRQIAEERDSWGDR
jgi:hypothetical protein